MSVLVVYASKYGSTREIAERIAEKLRLSGLTVDTRSAKDAVQLSVHDAYVIGSAVYMFSWMKEATRLVEANRDLLSTRPVWLFSSGPLGNDTKDAQGRDIREVSSPKQLPLLMAAIKPHGHQMFFGAMNPAKIALPHRLLAMLPATKTLFAQGDYRDWPNIDAWAEGIARELTMST